MESSANMQDTKMEPIDHEQLADAPLPQAENSHTHAGPPVANGNPQEAHQLTHAYNPYQAIPPAAQDHQPEQEAHIHPDLRSPHQSYIPVANMMPAPAPAAPAPPPTMVDPSHAMHSSPASHLMPGPPPDSGEAAQPFVDGRKVVKRELSQSKRAAQNRAAQRAFRQRKEGYIKKLEQQVKDYSDIDNTMRALQSELYALREYTLLLQSHLMAAQGDYPPPPPNVNLEIARPPPGPDGAPVGVPPPPGSVHAPQMGAAPPEANNQPAMSDAGANLEQVAQAVANLGRVEQVSAEDASAYAEKAYKADEEVRAAQELSRQLHESGLPA